ncbi:MAG: NAD(P)/FAD-dependent oxidoreductase [Terriglobia bacterium]
MTTYKYLIVGGGMTAAAAVEGIRAADTSGSIGVIGAEPDPPYNRPPLSKGLWKGESEDGIWRGTEKQGVKLHRGRTVQALDLGAKSATDDTGAVHEFEKLLLATGATPRRLPFGGDSIIYFRTFQDYRALRSLTEKGQRFAVIGGGFIGWEIAAALAMNDRQVTMIFPDDAIGSHIYPQGLALSLSAYYREKGVEIISGDTAMGIEKTSQSLKLKTKNGRDLVVDGVVAGIGVTPNVALAQAAGLHIENGIVVDEHLRTSNPDVYAAGDVANFFNPALGKRIRVEHEDNANTMGRAAGKAMASQPGAYQHLPFFYSDLFELGYEAVGDLDPELEIAEDWKEPYREGVVYYLRDGRVRGVLLWNIFGQVDPARELIGEPGPFRAGDLKGRLPKAG